MLYEDLRFIHEDVERLEQAIAERQLDNPRQNRNRLARDHEIAYFARRIQEQSKRGLQLYNDKADARMQERQSISTGDTFKEFYERYGTIKEFHKKYTNEKVENLEIAYKKPDKGGPPNGFAPEMNSIFTGEEAFGKFFDLTLLHEEYVNLPGIKGVRRFTYLQYLDIFDHFTPPGCNISRSEKLTDQYFSYVGSLAQYLDSFMRKTQPLEDLDKIFVSFDNEFEKEWEAGTITGWEHKATTNGATNGLATQGTGEGVWCADCEREFKNDNLYKSHLSGKKHIRAAEAKAQQTDGVAAKKPAVSVDLSRLKEKAVAEREHRIRKLASTMQTVRADTRVNVERKAGMTDRERQEEIEALYADEDNANAANEEEEAQEEDKERIYNPLKLPLAWDGNPIPFWLYKLHGLGTEYPCEICGNFVYQGRRNFEKHFSESRHIHGLRCLGITSTGLFREITKIEEAEMLWEKLKGQKKEKTFRPDDVVEMEDNSGTVMPLKIYNDLASEGLL